MKSVANNLRWGEGETACVRKSHLITQLTWDYIGLSLDNHQQSFIHYSTKLQRQLEALLKVFILLHSPSVVLQKNIVNRTSQYDVNRTSPHGVFCTYNISYLVPFVHRTSSMWVLYIELLPCTSPDDSTILYIFRPLQSTIYIITLCNDSLLYSEAQDMGVILQIKEI